MATSKSYSVATALLIVPLFGELSPEIALRGCGCSSLNPAHTNTKGRTAAAPELFALNKTRVNTSCTFNSGWFSGVQLICMRTNSNDSRSVRR